MTTAQRRLLVLLPIFLLACSFAAICVRAGSLWPWNSVVHEDGKRSLLQTVFYFEHALGELPLDILLAMGLAAAVTRFFSPIAKVKWLPLWMGAIAVDLFIAIGACYSVGADVAASWLLQKHTRDGAPLQFGSHWQYHFLSQAFLLLFASLLTRVMIFCTSLGARPVGRKINLTSWTWIAFATGTLICVPSVAPFTDSLYLGHQARETFTHALITIPLGLFACLIIARPVQEATVETDWRGIARLGGACLVLAGYQVIGAFIAGARQHSQSNDPVKLICGHFFEHALDYLAVAMNAAAIFATPSPRERIGVHP